MSFRTKLYTSVIAGAFILAGAGQALAIETTARNVILTDYDTGQILFAKDHQKMVPPASMSKLMTVYIIFSKLKDGSLSLDDTFTVSENAWRKGGAASGGSTTVSYTHLDVYKRQGERRRGCFCSYYGSGKGRFQNSERE